VTGAAPAAIAGDVAGAARAAFERVRSRPGVREVEVFVAAGASHLARLSYTSHIPSSGVEEPKSVESRGLGIRAVFDGPDGPLVGFGSEAGDLTPDAAERALARARAAAVADPEFVSLPRPRGRPPAGRDDPRPAPLDDAELVRAGWRMVTGALRAFLAAAPVGDEEALRRLGLVVGGDVRVLQDRIAVVSTHMPEVQTDASTVVSASVTALVEAWGSTGSGWATGTRLEHLTDEAAVEAVRRALAGAGGERVAPGDYTVVFGPQPVADLLDNLVLPALTASAFYASATPFLGRLGRRVAVPALTLADDAAAPGLAGSRAVTCEGLPTGRTDLVRDGMLVGCLSNWYQTQRLLRDPGLAAKLGAGGPAAEAALAPRNGFRSGPGGRRFDTPPGIAASNVVLTGADAVGRDELIRRVGHGLYVGRIWYTYPINGLAAGDFTCTVVGDSYVIRDGRLAAPLRPNTVRIDDNVVRLLDRIVGFGRDLKGTVVWGADAVAYVPEIAVAGVPVGAIGAAGEAPPV